MNRSLMAVAMVVVMVTAAVFAVASVSEDSEATYAKVDLSGGHDTVVTFAGTNYTLVKEADMDQYTVKRPSWINVLIDVETIDVRSFKGMIIQEVVLSENVRTIKANAFEDCTSLKFVSKIGDTPITIEGEAFKGCSSLMMLDVRATGSVASNATDSPCKVYLLTNGSSIPSIAHYGTIRMEQPISENYLVRFYNDKLDIVYEGVGQLECMIDGSKGTHTKIDQANFTSYVFDINSGNNIIIQYVRANISYGAFGLGSQTFPLDGSTLSLRSPPLAPGVGSFPGWENLNSGTVFGMELTLNEVTSFGGTRSFTLIPSNDFTMSFSTSGLPSSEGVTNPSSMTYSYGMTYPDVEDTARYSFKGWNVSGGNGVLLHPGQAIAHYGNQTLNAVWEPKADAIWTVTYEDFSGNTFLTATVKQGDQFTITDSVPSDLPTGKIFQGWIMNGTQVHAGDSKTGAGDVTLTPQYREPRTFTMTLPDGTTTSGTEQDTFTIPWDDLGDTDSEIFLGWSVTGESGTLSKGDSFIIGGDTTIAPAYRDRYVYDISFMDGDSLLYTDEATEGMPFTISVEGPADTPTAIFTGWDLGGTMMQNGGSFIADGDTSVHAVWRDRETCTISFMDGDDVLYTDTTLEGIPYTISGEDPEDDTVRIFTGWKMGDVDLCKEDQITVVVDTEVHSVWRDRTDCTAIFPVGDTSYTIPVKEGLPFVIEFTDTDVSLDTQESIFVGWTIAGLPGGPYVVGSEVYITEDTEFTPVWRDREVYSVQFMNGATLYREVEAIEGLPFVIHVDDPVYEGHEFRGWVNEDSDARFSKGDSVTIAGDAVMSAVWADSVMVRYVSEGVTVKSYSHFEGDVISVGTHVSKEFHRLLSWNDGIDDVSIGSNYILHGDVMFEAVWERLPTVDVTYHSQDGTEVITILKGSEFTVDSDPGRKPGYTFLGWTDESGAEVRYDNGGTYVFTDDVDLFPVWEKVSTPPSVVPDIPDGPTTGPMTPPSDVESDSPPTSDGDPPSGDDGSPSGDGSYGSPGAVVPDIPDVPDVPSDDDEGMGLALPATILGALVATAIALLVMFYRRS